jgi:hypothetical protein
MGKVDEWSWHLVPKDKYAGRYENNMLRKIFGAMREDVPGWRKLHNKDLPNLPHQLQIGWQIKEDKMGRACGMYGGEEKCIDHYDGKTWTETTWMTTGRWTSNIKMDLTETCWDGINHITGRSCFMWYLFEQFYFNATLKIYSIFQNYGTIFGLTRFGIDDTQ